MGIAVRELVTIWGFDIDGKPLKDLDNGLKNIQGSVKAIGLLVVGASAAIFGLAKSTAIAGDEIAKTADKLGVGIETLQELQFAAGRAGVGIKSFNIGLQRFTRRAAEAAAGTGEAKEALSTLGIQLTDSQGNLRPTAELLSDMADAFKKVPSQAERVRLAFKLFDTEGVQLVNLLQLGSGALDDFRKRARELGLVMSEKTARDSERFQDAQQDLLATLTGVRNLIGGELLPILTELTLEFTEFISTNRELIKVNVGKAIKILIDLIEDLVKIVRTTVKIFSSWAKIFGGTEKLAKALFKTLSTILALKFAVGIGQAAQGLFFLGKRFALMGNQALIAQAKLFLIPLAIAAIIAAIALIAEDIFAFTQGEDSVIGRLISGFQEAFPELTKFFTGLFDIISFVVKDTIKEFQGFFSLMLKIGAGIKEFFDPLFGFIFKALKKLGGLIGPLLGRFGSFLSKRARELEGANQTGVLAMGGGRAAASAGGVTSRTFNQRNIRAKNEININVQGLPPDAAERIARESIDNQLGEIFRETGRTVEPAVER